MGSVAGNFVGGGDWKPMACHRLNGRCAYSAPWVVGFGQPIGLLCGLSAYIVNMEGKTRRKEYKTLYSDKGGSRGYKKEMVVSRQPTLINLKSNTMKNTLQM